MAWHGSYHRAANLGVRGGHSECRAQIYGGQVAAARRRVGPRQLRQVGAPVVDGGVGHGHEPVV